MLHNDLYLIGSYDTMDIENESKTGVLKNTISFGISRTKLYVARFLTQLIVLVAAIVLVSGSLLLGNLVFNGGCSHEALMTFVRSIAYTTILWIASLSFAHALAMCLNSNSLGTVIYILYFLIVNSVIEMVHMAMPNNAIVTFMSKYELYEFGSRTIVRNEVANNLANYFWVGGGYLLVTFGLGIFFFRRKEVK